MSNTKDLSILFPVGRIVQGNLYKGNDRDMDGRPKVYPPGHAKAGQAKVSYFFGLAIAKNPGEQHWAQTLWGRQIWDYAHAAWPNGQAQLPSFAWKIEDGDSPQPNKRGRVNAQTIGMPGHWIVGFSSSFAPKIYTADGSQPLTAVDYVKPGFYVEVLGTIASNETAGNPGIYINHSMVAFRAPGEEIRTGPDPRTVGFGRTGLPPGVSATPTGNTSTLPAGVPPIPPTGPGTPPFAQPPHAPTGVPPVPAGPSTMPTPVAPAPAFLAPPTAAAAPPLPPAPAAAPAPPPPAPVGPVMTAKAAGQPYANFIASGWNDQQLRAHGYML